jgi:putative OPT family oligopeptide transporter
VLFRSIIGIIRSSKIISGAFSLAYKEIFTSKVGVTETSVRWQTDIKMLYVVLLILLTALMIFVFFYSGVVFNLTHAVVGLLIVIIIAFLFTTVAANAIAIVGTNPVSGMTLMTLILSSFILTQVGLTGNQGMMSALIIGGVVCTALSMAGGFITDLKIGYWLGSTPKKQESWKFLGTIVSAATVAGVILVLNQSFGFKGEHAMVAPQANAMAAVIQPLMGGAGAPWMLYLVGAVIALLLTMVKIPPLAFALGMYIPQELNTPLVAGGLIAWWVTSRTKNEKLNNARFSRGTLIASGFIAGGALFGVLNAFLRFIDDRIKFGYIDWYRSTWAESVNGEILGMVMFALLFTYMVVDTMRAKEDA